MESTDARRFVAFMPLGNWARGFDRYRMAYSKSWNPSARHPGRFYMLGSDEPAEPGLRKAFELASRLGEPAAEVAWIECELAVGAGRMEPNVFTGTGVGWAWPSEEVPLARFGVATPDGARVELRHEELTARSFAAARTRGAMDWLACAPRTFSVLPVARACQASCAFCFSKASASEAARQARLDPAAIEGWAKAAFARGARRAVVTGGGEPTLRPLPELGEICRTLSREVGPTLMISNGAKWGALPDAELRAAMREMAGSGLSRLALSRHGVGADAEAKALGVRADAARVARAASDAGLASRSICVMQRGFVDSERAARAYLEAMAREGVAEVCFKELYVSSLSENPWAASAENRFCEENQVPLGVAEDACRSMGLERASELPWGAPVYRGRVGGLDMSVACYVEPSVGWELSAGVVRSWNLFADGSCLASLEDPESRLPEAWAREGAPR